jgi:hypothetical protein
MSEWSQFRRIAAAILGVPKEIAMRLARRRWTLEQDVKYWSPDGWSLTAKKGMKYDSFTFAPNLRRSDGTRSQAAAIHDRGWESGHKDDGSLLTFDENNTAFRSVLDDEGHPEKIKDLYERGVSLPVMRQLWRRKHGHE